MSTVDAAYHVCADIARNHYENFPVASVLVPRHMRRSLTAVYAFARKADDIADEPWTDDSGARLAALSELENALTAPTSDPVMVALQDTIGKKRLPLAPFKRLLAAFRSDVEFRAPESWDDVLAYCALSANPVGEIYLRLEYGPGEPPQAAIEASDALCTALQVTNFLQDMGVDASRGRVYVPISETEALSKVAILFRRGSAVTRFARSFRTRLELRLIWLGGLIMLRLCAVRTNPHLRPSLSAKTLWRIFDPRVYTSLYER